jgi:hypothetical protein
VKSLHLTVVACIFALSWGSVHAQTLRITVTATVPATSDFASTVQKARPIAIEAARRNLWFQLKGRDDFEKIVFNFETAQDAEMVAKTAQHCGDVLDAGQTYDKKLRQLTFKFIFACNSQGLIRDASRLNATLAPGVARPVRARLTGIFIAIKDERVESFDPTVKTSQIENQGENVAVDNTEKKDEREKKAVRDVWGEGKGKASEMTERRVVGGITESSTSSRSTTRTTNNQSAGSTVRQSANVSRVIVSAQEIQRALVPVLQRDRFGFVPYGTVSSRCNSLPFESIQAEVRNLPADLPLALRDATRDAVLRVASQCQLQNGESIQYYVEGYAKIGAPSIEPGTGDIRVSVNVSQSIYDVVTGEEISTTPEQQVYGSGDDETVATSNALKEAAALVGQTTVANLSGLGI